MYATTTYSGAFETMFITLIRSGYAETPARETMSRDRKAKTGEARARLLLECSELHGTDGIEMSQRWYCDATTGHNQPAQCEEA